MVLDVLLRLNLSTDKLRGQTYDGARAMSGCHTGVQARLKESQPLALFVHCGAHCVNLVVQESLSSSAFISDCVSLVHEVGIFFSRNVKMRQVFGELAKQSESSSKVLKPLCPTRWTVRTPAISQALTCYEAICNSFEELRDCPTASANAKTQARGLLQQFLNGSTLLGFKLALTVMEPLESLSGALQDRAQTVAGMLSAVRVLQRSFNDKRSEPYFALLFAETQQRVGNLGLQTIAAPRQRRPPARYSGPGESHQYPNAEAYYRQEYFKLLDSALVHLSERFDQPDFAAYKQLEQAVLTGETNSTTDEYPELGSLLSCQLQMFKTQNNYKTVAEAVSTLLSLGPGCRALYQKVEQLLRLCLVIPASSSEAERSFSAFRRLKTWLRNSMSQERLSNAAVCHVHQKRLDMVDMASLAKEFSNRNEVRQLTFAQ